ncbi:MAG: sigma-70 family RNA polymerase sigma factor, partial [Planctomycetales bacterium]|nr:sigma-70 family RNA polymerase sigma factor [Planctomycetales bacterium]
NRAVRRAPSVATEPQTLEATVETNETPFNAAVTGERAAHVHSGLQRLRELDRDTLVAFYVRGQTLIEMSASFDAPIGTIKRRLHVARQRLAREVEHLVSC